MPGWGLMRRENKDRIRFGVLRPGRRKRPGRSFLQGFSTDGAVRFCIRSAAAAVRQGGTHVGGRLGTFETFSQEWTIDRGYPENFEYVAYIIFKKTWDLPASAIGEAAAPRPVNGLRRRILPARLLSLSQNSGKWVPAILSFSGRSRRPIPFSPDR